MEFASGWPRRALPQPPPARTRACEFDGAARIVVAMHARAGEQASRVGGRASGGLSEESAGGEGEDSELRCRPARAGLESGGAVARERREKVDRGRCEIWVGCVLCFS
jgi:hypothetical protein